MMWSGGCQSKLFQQLDRGSFLAFETVWVHRVQKINRHALHHFIQHAHAAVEVSLQLAGDGAVVEGLRKFSPGDLALRNQDQAAHSCTRGVSGHRSRSVAGGGARHPAEASLPGERRGCRHAGIFERPGRIHALMFGEELLNSRGAAAGRQLIKRRVAFPQSDDLFPVVQSRKNFAKTPDPAFIQSIARSAALQPELFEPGRIQSAARIPAARLPAGKNHFQQIATLCAADALGAALRPRSARNAAQLRYAGSSLDADAAWSVIQVSSIRDG